MERFEGIFIAATNLFCVLDRAALRRFTFKLEFLPPTREQRVALVLRELSQGLCDEQRRSLAEGVAAMHGLTPGDIVVVVRRARLLSLCPSAEQTLLLLRAELRARGATWAQVSGSSAMHPTPESASKRPGTIKCRLSAASATGSSLPSIH
jgi:SpoVK/Ycf46/Vps4 family AAA+-type ATPase